jgi:hypothetical protein
MAKKKGWLTASRAVLLQGVMSSCMILAMDLSGLVLINAIIEWCWYFVFPPSPAPPQETNENHGSEDL